MSTFEEPLNLGKMVGREQSRDLATNFCYEFRAAVRIDGSLYFLAQLSRCLKVHLSKTHPHSDVVGMRFIGMAHGLYRIVQHVLRRSQLAL